MKLAAALLLLPLAPLALGQGGVKKNNPYRVIVSCTCADSTGQAFATSLRDRIATSPRYEEISNTLENRKSAIELSIVSVDVFPKNLGHSSAFAVAMTIDGSLYDLWVQTASVHTAGSAAATLLSSMDEDVSKFQAEADAGQQKVAYQ
jgi:hypothetical protein